MATQLILEWIATVLSLAGSLLMALKLGRKIEKLVWVLWLSSGLLLIGLFTLSGQTGLLAGQLVGLLSSSLGLISLFIASQLIAKRLRQASLCLAVVGMLTIVYAGWLLASRAALPHFELVSATLAGTASFLMASQSRFSGLAWVCWSVANSVGVVTSLYREQYGLACLNLVFMSINTLGLYRWFFLAPNEKERLSRSGQAKSTPDVSLTVSANKPIM